MINNSNKLLAALDATFGFPNQTSSTFRKLRQFYDNKRGQHVIWLAYIVKVNPGDTDKTVVKSQPVRGALFQAITARQR
jgi:hypothetical protein